MEPIVLADVDFCNIPAYIVKSIRINRKLTRHNAIKMN